MTGTENETGSAPYSPIWDEVQAERDRAHAKHGDTSMEALPVDDLTRLTVLMEEVGEVAREFNEARHHPPLDRGRLRKELIQVAAMAGAWADVLTEAPDA
jgi:NTP pyrophosphatase (non-canonical NTP hydrolase)